MAHLSCNLGEFDGLCIPPCPHPPAPRLLTPGLNATCFHDDLLQDAGEGGEVAHVPVVLGARLGGDGPQLRLVYGVGDTDHHDADVVHLLGASNLTNNNNIIWMLG